jgi:hypothetical protein
LYIILIIGKYMDSVHFGPGNANYSLGEVKKSTTPEGVQVFRQEVRMGEKTFTVSAFYSDSSITMDKAESDLRLTIGKAIELATKLELGQSGLKTIKVTPNEVLGTWKNHDGGVVVKNFKETLIAERKSLLDPQRTFKKENIELADVIDEKIALIDTTTNLFKQFLEKSKSRELPAPAQERSNDLSNKTFQDRSLDSSTNPKSSGTPINISKREEATLSPKDLKDQQRIMKNLGILSRVPDKKGKKPISLDIDTYEISIHEKEIEEPLSKEFVEIQNECAALLDIVNQQAKVVVEKANGIDQKEIGSLNKLQNAFIDKYNLLEKLEKTETPRSQSGSKANLVREMRHELAEISNILRIETEKEKISAFNDLIASLESLTESLEYITYLRKGMEASKAIPQEIQLLRDLEGTVRSKVKECNTVMSQTSLTTNSVNIAKSHVMPFGGLVEKKMALLERKYQIEQNIEDFKSDDHIKRNAERSAILNKELKKVEKELKGAPKIEKVLACGKKIADDLTAAMSEPEGKIVTAEQAQALNRAYPELKWGASHLLFALTNPANWMTIRKAVIKESTAENAYIAVTIIEPLGIGKEGGVPAGLRDVEGYRHRPANLNKTTTCIIGTDGEVRNTMVSFRGGQFPNPKAAENALLQMLEHQPNLEELHINALLTPTKMSPRPDKQLLETHYNSIETAVQNLIDTLDDPEKVNSLRILQNQMAFSNFGVNEGAVGQYELMGKQINMQVGWLTSIGEYSNEASQRLNGSLQRMFTSMYEGLDPNSPQQDKVQFLKRLNYLAAVVHVGQEMEAVWASNAYADATVGNNQYKMAALWKTMDMLLDVVSYTDCMSGKDRTGKTEGNANELLDEIGMSLQDQVIELTSLFDSKSALLSPEMRKVWEEQKDFLTVACFTKQDLENIFRDFNQKQKDEFLEESLDNIVRDQLLNKIILAETALGYGSNGPGLMQSKTIKVGSDFKELFKFNGISTNTPKMSNPEYKAAAKHFPEMIVTSVFAEPIKLVGLTRDQLIAIGPELEERQREAYNRRLSQFPSLENTRTNTSKPGYKIKAMQPEAIFSSGFDRTFVVRELLLQDSSHIKGQFSEWIGGSELEKDLNKTLLDDLLKIKNNSKMSDKDKIKKWEKVLATIEEHKKQTLYPKSPVKS